MDASQITGTSSSYARNYALNWLFNIDDTKDADTDEYTKVTKDEETTKDKIKKFGDKAGELIKINYGGRKLSELSEQEQIELLNTLKTTKE